MRKPSEIREIADNAANPEDRAAARRLLYTGRCFEEFLRVGSLSFSFRAPQPPHIKLGEGCRLALRRGEL